MQIKASAEAAKAKLEKQKKTNSDWTDAKQEELDEVVVFIVDLEEYIDERKKKESEQPEAESVYTPAKGTEKHVHVSIVRGYQFNPNTGKRISKPYAQMFTFAEWQLFKKSYKRLGYSIVSVLHDPYGDAAELVEKSE